MTNTQAENETRRPMRGAHQSLQLENQATQSSSERGRVCPEPQSRRRGSEWPARAAVPGQGREPPLQ